MAAPILLLSGRRADPVSQLHSLMDIHEAHLGHHSLFWYLTVFSSFCPWSWSASVCKWAGGSNYHFCLRLPGVLPFRRKPSTVLQGTYKTPSASDDDRRLFITRPRFLLHELLNEKKCRHFVCTVVFCQGCPFVLIFGSVLGFQQAAAATYARRMFHPNTCTRSCCCMSQH